MGSIIAILISLILWLPLVALWGWALSILWGWFIVPVFELPMLTYYQAIGIGLVVSFLTKNIDTKKDGREILEIVVAGLFVNIARPLLAVGAGWVYMAAFG